MEACISGNPIIISALVIGTSTVASFVYFKQRCVNFFQIFRKKCEQLIHSKGLKIYLIESSDDWAKIPPSFFLSVEKSKIIGLDCEWVSRDTKEPVALLQISSDSGECLLIRLCKVKKILPKIQEVLENEEIIKVGVGIDGDAYRVSSYGVSVRGWLDLRHLLLSRQDKEKGKKKMGLAGLSAEFLGIALDKDLQITCSDWEAPRLTKRQIDYASLDAFVSVPIFCELINDLYHISIKERFLPVTSSESWAAARRIVKPYLERQWKAGTHQIKSKVSNDFPPMKGSCHQNYVIEASDGKILSSRAGPQNAFLSKDLADQTTQEIRCVVCGQTESCVRKNIVPEEYRIVPKGTSHDVLLLCVTCHKISNNCDQELRKRLAQECRAPIGAIDKVKATNPLLKKAVSAAKAIKSAKDKIPFDRLAELKAIITEYYNVSLLTSEVLSLEILWRKHFIDSMKPKFLPPHWPFRPQ